MNKSSSKKLFFSSISGTEMILFSRPFTYFTNDSVIFLCHLNMNMIMMMACAYAWIEWWFAIGPRKHLVFLLLDFRGHFKCCLTVCHQNTCWPFHPFYCALCFVCGFVLVDAVANHISLSACRFGESCL